VTVDAFTARLWQAVHLYLEDPLQPPSSDSIYAVAAALDSLIAAHWYASADGVTVGLITREKGTITFTGGLYSVDPPAGRGRPPSSMRPLAAELSPTLGATIRIGAALRPTESFNASTFTDTSKIRRWEPTIRLPPEGP
jgi:hypothetical protein